MEEGIVAGGGVALINTIPAVEKLLDTDDADFKTGVKICAEGAGGAGAPDRCKRRPGG